MTISPRLRRLIDRMKRRQAERIAGGRFLDDGSWKGEGKSRPVDWEAERRNRV